MTVYPKKYAHGFCFAMLCCGYTLTGFPISIRLTSLALWQSNDCPSASKQPWWIWINTSCEFIMDDYITTTKQSTMKPCAYFLGYTVQQFSCDIPGPHQKKLSRDLYRSRYHGQPALVSQSRVYEVINSSIWNTMLVGYWDWLHILIMQFIKSKLTG